MKINTSILLKATSLESAYKKCRQSLHSFLSYTRYLMFVKVIEENNSDKIISKIWSRRGTALENLGQGKPRKVTVQLLEVGDDVQVNITIQPYEPISEKEFIQVKSFWVDFIPLYTKRLGAELSTQLRDLYTNEVIQTRLSYLDKLLKGYSVIWVVFFVLSLIIMVMAGYVNNEPFIVYWWLYFGVGFPISLAYLGDYYERKRFINKIISKIGSS